MIEAALRAGLPGPRDETGEPPPLLPPPPPPPPLLSLSALHKAFCFDEVWSARNTSPQGCAGLQCRSAGTDTVRTAQEDHIKHYSLYQQPSDTFKSDIPAANYTPVLVYMPVLDIKYPLHIKYVSHKQRFHLNDFAYKRRMR